MPWVDLSIFARANVSTRILRVVKRRLLFALLVGGSGGIVGVHSPNEMNTFNSKFERKEMRPAENLLEEREKKF